MKRRYKIAILLCALLIAYPLSIGPMGMVLHADVDHPAVGHFIYVVYYPLMYADDHCVPFRMAFQWYLDLWWPPTQ